MVVALIAFVAAAGQWYLADRQYGPALAAKTGRGVVLLGHATWAAVLACLVEAMEGEQEGKQEGRVRLAGVDDDAETVSVDEKSPTSA